MRDYQTSDRIPNRQSEFLTTPPRRPSRISALLRERDTADGEINRLGTLLSALLLSGVALMLWIGG